MVDVAGPTGRLTLEDSIRASVLARELDRDLARRNWNPDNRAAALACVIRAIADRRARRRDELAHSGSLGVMPPRRAEFQDVLRLTAFAARWPVPAINTLQSAWQTACYAVRLANGPANAAVRLAAKSHHRPDPEAARALQAQLAKGREDGVQAGRRSSGPIAFGYRRVPGRRRHAQVAHDPAEAMVVREIFRLYLELRSLSRVSAALRERRIKTRNGNDWSKAALQWVLGNPFYVGLVRYGPVVAAPGRHERIVPDDVFASAQTLLAGRLLSQTGRQAYKPARLLLDLADLRVRDRVRVRANLIWPGGPHRTTFRGTVVRCDRRAKSFVVLPNPRQAALMLKGRDLGCVRYVLPWKGCRVELLVR